jgi:hypothetical protein
MTKNIALKIWTAFPLDLRSEKWVATWAKPLNKVK